MRLVETVSLHARNARASAEDASEIMTALGLMGFDVHSVRAAMPTDIHIELDPGSMPAEEMTDVVRSILASVGMRPYSIVLAPSVVLCDEEEDDDE